ncbi:MAG: hypothetical protein ABJL54_00200 [Halioglobus sp.]
MKKILSIAALMVAVPAMGAQEWHQANVTRTLIQDGAWGTCMAMISPSLSATGLNCKPDWVSFSCSGHYNSPEVGGDKMEAAQLSLITESQVIVLVNDAKKHNGYCFAERVDNLAK